MMKKILSLCLVLMLSLSLLSCAPKEKTLAPGANPWGISLSAQNVSPTGLTLTISQSGGSFDGELQYGAEFVLRQKLDETWQDVPGSRDIAWNSLAYLLPENSTKQSEIQWDSIYGALTPGTYQIGKSFMNFRDTGDFDKEMVWTEFVVE